MPSPSAEIRSGTHPIRRGSTTKSKKWQQDGKELEYTAGRRP